jgi:hypothetical protein
MLLSFTPFCSSIESVTVVVSAFMLGVGSLGGFVSGIPLRVNQVPEKRHVDRKGIHSVFRIEGL